MGENPVWVLAERDTKGLYAVSLELVGRGLAYICCLLFVVHPEEMHDL